MKEFLKKLSRGNRLTTDEAYRAMTIIMNGDATDAQIGAYLMLLRGGQAETVDEITGSAKAMREKGVRIQTDPADEDLLIDTCGTGGSGLNPFNISTAVSFILAAAGLKVAKHGNRGVSSTSGSADVLKQLGVNIEASPEVVSECIHEIGVGYMFAPAMHPAMKHAIGPRREIGLRTVFNVLGPLSNPARAKRHVMGVYDADLVVPLAEVHKQLGTKCAMVVHGNDGLDEITTTTTTRIAILKDGQVTTDVIDPSALGFEKATIDQLQVADPAASATMVRDVLDNKDGSALNVVVLNAGAGLLVGGKADDLSSGISLARSLLADGTPKELLNKLIEKTQS